MTVIWFIVWLCSNSPRVAHWNSWMVTLAVCFAIDVVGLRAGRR